MADRVIIEGIRPRTPNGFAAKAVVGRPLRVSADVFRDGHDILAARVRWRAVSDGSAKSTAKNGKKWQAALLDPVGNDRFETVIHPSALGAHEFIVEGWTDRLATWRHDVTVKLEAGQSVDVELEEGAQLLEEVAGRVPAADRGVVLNAAEALRDPDAGPGQRLVPALDPGLIGLLAEIPDPSDLAQSRAMPLWVDRERAAHGAWYELFPRSYGGLPGATERLDGVAAMGFDVVYVPPVHPIGSSFRKGKNNSLIAGPDDPGSPWGIGSADGGHTALHPDLGTFADFDRFVGRARELGMEVALDYALQCSPEHPWVTSHPEWFHHRPDGSIKYAENPPKKYQDIYPINMWPAAREDRTALWQACKEILDFWIGHGIRIFRVDNPHTKPFAFWEWVIAEIQKEHPDIVFLAEAFTRPKLMARLAEVGFSQSYTYFTWRNTKPEFVDYLAEIALSEKADYMRPNFWPNTPDILAGVLRHGSPGAFRLRLVLAAMLTPAYGIYSGYELYENEPAAETNEEYLNSEKYEIKHRDFDTASQSYRGSLVPFITKINEIRRRHPALGELTNIQFHHTNNPWLLAFSKTFEDDVMLVVVNLDTGTAHDDTLGLDLGALRMPADAPYAAHDELTDQTFIWNGPNPYVRLTPDFPAHVLHLRWMPGQDFT